MLNKSYKDDAHARRVDGFALLPEDEERTLDSVSSWARQQEARKTYVSLITWACLNVGPILPRVVRVCLFSLPPTVYVHDLLAQGRLGDAEKWVSEWYGDDPRRSLPRMTVSTPTGTKRRGGSWQTARKT
jgi:hypothetical protein